MASRGVSLLSLPAGIRAEAHTVTAAHRTDSRKTAG